MFSKKHIYLLLFCFVFNLTLTAQDRNKAIALKTVLQSIEKNHHIIFNYIETDIVEIEIIPPNPSLSLAEKLNELRKKTNLIFENLNNKFSIKTSFEFYLRII